MYKLYKGDVFQLLTDDKPIKGFSVRFVNTSIFCKLENGEYYDLISENMYPTEKDITEKGFYIDSTTLKRVNTPKKRIKRARSVK